MGFYPVCPGSNEYIIGSPRISEAKIHLENGNTFSMKATNLSKDNIYIQEVILNGEKLNTYRIQHESIIQGGELEFIMGDKPNKELF